MQNTPAFLGIIVLLICLMKVDGTTPGMSEALKEVANAKDINHIPVDNQAVPSTDLNYDLASKDFNPKAGDPSSIPIEKDTISKTELSQQLDEHYSQEAGRTYSASFFFTCLFGVALFLGIGVGVYYFKQVS